MMTQLFSVIETLQTSPETRQAVLSIWHPMDAYEVAKARRKDIPCTLSLQFLVREGRLNLIVTMRSNDIWLGLPYDIFCWTTLQAFIAEELGLGMGWYQHQAGSLHLYEYNYIDAKIAVDIEPEHSYQFCFRDQPPFALGRKRANQIELGLRSLGEISRGSMAAITASFNPGSRWGFLLTLAMLQAKEGDWHPITEELEAYVPAPVLEYALHWHKKRKGIK
jgi:hypothetical protein